MPESEHPPLTRAEANAYLEEQDLQKMLQVALNQAALERAPNGALRVAELLQKAAFARENTATMKKLFEQADTDGNGLVTLDELRAFKKSIGEPLDEEETKAAFTSMGGDETGSVGFDAFCTWYEGAHGKGGQLSKRGDSAVGRRRASVRSARTSHENLTESTSSFAIADLKTTTSGEAKTLEFRVFFELAGAQISPWHDIPLYPNKEASTSVVNMIVEIPKFSRAKFEIATGEALNPIKQDTKKGRLREYNWGDMLFNYGAFPQTWEDPSHTTPDTGAAGDNDPIDAVEIGTKIFATGAVVPVKVLGCLAMIDDGETDWKVICVAVDDPLAAVCNDVGDVEAAVPGLISVMREWLRKYKTVDGKPENTFGLEEKAMDKAYTLSVIEETHEFWKALTATGRLSLAAE